MRPALAFLLLATTAQAQWQLQQSNTTADLRGIHALPNGIAWASGTHGTVLRTTDAGTTWLPCATPPAAEALDFRGIQAFDATTAIVMSSGKGDLSRLYITTDSCKTWKLVFTNPDPEGFWDALLLNRLERNGVLFGDPVDGRIVVWTTEDRGERWRRISISGLEAQHGEGAFAASNSSMTLDGHNRIVLATGSAAHARTLVERAPDGDFESHEVPLAAGRMGAGIFSLAYRTTISNGVIGADTWVAVGGDYTKPAERAGTAAFSNEDGHRWKAAQTPPHGYRSAVAYSAPQKTWITVGPNGTDISRDDGRNWQPLNPQSEESQHWNALSLPYVVGPHGRIGTLSPDALTH